MAACPSVLSGPLEILAAHPRDPCPPSGAALASGAMERPAGSDSSSEQPGAAEGPADSVTRGFLFSDLRDYTAFIETKGDQLRNAQPRSHGKVDHGPITDPEPRRRIWGIQDGFGLFGGEVVDQTNIGLL